MRSAFLFADPLPIEVYSIVMLTLWGLWVALPTGVFDSSHAFRVLAESGPHWAVGGTLLAVGLFQASSISFDLLGPRRFAAMASLLAWMYLALALLFGNPHAPGFAIYVCLALSQGWAYLRLGAWVEESKRGSPHP